MEIVNSMSVVPQTMFDGLLALLYDRHATWAAMLIGGRERHSAAAPGSGWSVDLDGKAIPVSAETPIQGKSGF